MNYTLNRLNPTDFEHLVQSLMQKMLGYNSIVFGTGADGGREMTFEGKANFPNENNKWGGNWIIQAKYKMQEDGKNEYVWVAGQLGKELKKISLLESKPDNYIFLTNVKLTGNKDTGGRDKIENLRKRYPQINNIFIGGYDDICRFLDNNRDVATAYSSFILTGDVLIQALQTIQKKKYSEAECLDKQNKLSLYYLKELEIESKSKLIQAGDFANHNINLERVFMDLEVEVNEYIEGKFPKKYMAVSYIVDESNKISRPGKNHKKFVFLGGAGAGKSTISQYLYLLYICYFLKNICRKSKIEINEFIEEGQTNKIKTLKAYRMPFRILLKDYAGWVNEKEIINESSSILRYLVDKINIESDIALDIEFMRELFRKFSFLFILDGLDEVPHSTNREKVIENINSFVEVELYNTDCDSIIIATTRPQGYMVEFNKEKYNHFNLSELSNDICMKYLEKLLKNIEKDPDIRNDYLNGLEKALLSETTSRLMRSPLQATIMAILVRSGGEPSSNKYELFKQYYETIFKREKQKKVYPIINKYENHINKIHNKLGFKLQNESQNIINIYSNISVDDFELLIREYLIAEEWTDSDIFEFIEEFKQTITQRLVFISEVETKRVGFVVRSIQEYFAGNYYMDSDDETVKTRIANIATSAYWRNTFLFCVGYIRLNKNHLIDFIYSYCHGLNENFDEDRFAINTKINPGSWLALDILSEGIFNDTPKNYNRFGSLLHLLLKIPYIEDHKKFENLLGKIKDKWVVDKIILDSNSVNYNPETVYIITVMYLNIDSVSIKLKCLSILKNTKSNYLPTVVRELIKYQIFDETFDNLLSRTLIESENLLGKLFINELIHSDQINVLPSFIEKKGIDSLEAKLLFEHIILLALSGILYYDESEVLDAILKSFNPKWPKTHNILSDRSYDFARLFFKPQEVRVSQDLVLIYKLTSQENLLPIEYLKGISQALNITYIEYFFKYILNPSFFTLKEFLIKLSYQKKDVISIFNEVKCNWHIQYCMNLWVKNIKDDGHPIDYLPSILNQSIALKDFESNLVKVIDLKTSMICASSFEFQSADSSENSILNIYYDKYLIDVETRYDQSDVELYYSLLSLNKDNFLYLTRESTKNFIKNILIDCYNNNDYDFSYMYFKAWIFYIELNNVDYLFNIISESNCFNNELLVNPYVFFFRRDFLDFDNIVIEKIFDLLNIFISLESSNSYPRLVRLLMSIPFFEKGDEYLFDSHISKINFHKLHRICYINPADSFSQFSLLLLSKNNPYESIEEAVVIFAQLIEKNIYFVGQLIRFLVQREIWTPWVIDLVCGIEPIIDLELLPDSVFKIQFYKYLKDYIDFKDPMEV